MRALYILFYFLLSSFLYADTTAVTENDPSSLVEGVSVITGDFYAQDEDIVIQGVQPIRLSRSYISQKGEGYWDFFSYHQIYIDWIPKLLEIREPSGAVLLYEKDFSRESALAFILKDTSMKGMTNTARGSLSGKYNLKNQKVRWVDENIVVSSADGTKRIYKGIQKFRLQEISDKEPKLLSSWDGGSSSFS